MEKRSTGLPVQCVSRKVSRAFSLVASPTGAVCSREGRGLSASVRSGVCVFALLVAVVGSGCTETFMIRGDHTANAHREAERGTPPEKLILPARDTDGHERLLRYNYLPLLPPVLSAETAVRVRLSDSRAERRSGTTLLILGLAHLAGFLGDVGSSAVESRRCSASPNCLGEGYSVLISGPILGTASLALLIPAIALLSHGYGTPRDAKPNRRDLIYVGAQQELVP